MGEILLPAEGTVEANEKDKHAIIRFDFIRDVFLERGLWDFDDHLSDQWCSNTLFWKYKSRDNKTLNQYFVKLYLII